MLTPARLTESQALAAYIDEQAGAILAAAHGLTDDQARATPCRSALSIGGLVKHATFVMAGPRRGGGDLTEADVAAFGDSFALRADETLAGAREAFEATRQALRERVAATDPDGDLEVPSAPWHGRHESTTATQRFQLLHLVEELARHAGHADIIREQIDGAGAGPLMLAQENLPGNDFMQPWTLEDSEIAGAHAGN